MRGHTTGRSAFPHIIPLYRLWAYTVPQSICRIAKQGGGTAVISMNRQELLFNLDVFASRVKAAFAHDQFLHTARFARSDELKPIASQHLNIRSLLLAETHYGHLLQVQPTPAHPELGNMLIVGRSRSGKGLHAGGQGFNWPDSFISNDLKSEARNLIGGGRKTKGGGVCFLPARGWS